MPDLSDSFIVGLQRQSESQCVCSGGLPALSHLCRIIPVALSLARTLIPHPWSWQKHAVVVMVEVCFKTHQQQAQPLHLIHVILFSRDCKANTSMGVRPLISSSPINKPINEY